MENGFQFAAAQEFAPFDIGFRPPIFVLLTTRRSHPSTLEIESQIPISNASNESTFLLSTQDSNVFVNFFWYYDC